MRTFRADCVRRKLFEYIIAEHCEELLFRHGIRPAAGCMPVAETMERFDDTFGLAGPATDSIDGSSAFRTLTLFSKRHPRHAAEDGSGPVECCVCRNGRTCRSEKRQDRFLCGACGRTMRAFRRFGCPDGFEIHRIDHVLRGLCPDRRRGCGGDGRRRGVADPDLRPGCSGFSRPLPG